MQGRKTFKDEKELRFSLWAHVPEHNFYRRLKQHLNLDFLYELTRPFYGRCGQHSIDPVVFFKLCLLGYLENIPSDRRLMEQCSLRNINVLGKSGAHKVMLLAAVAFNLRKHMKFKPSKAVSKAMALEREYIQAFSGRSIMLSSN